MRWFYVALLIRLILETDSSTTSATIGEVTVHPIPGGRQQQATNSNSSEHIIGRDELKIYIYQEGYWANISVACLQKRDPNEILEHSLNNGAGPLIDVSKGQYHTDQYQLFSLIYNRALKDPRRTLDPSEATTFVIPYDFASDAAYYKSCAKSTGKICYDFRKCPLAPRVEELLVASPWYQRKGGRDHLLIIGMNYAMDHYILKPKCKSLLSTVCANCTKLAIDDYSFLFGDNEGVVTRGDHWHAVPFPADFHWTRHFEKPYPWDNTDRPILVSYVGSGRSYYNPARRLRGSIIAFCEQYPNDCVHQTYGMNGTRFSFKVSGHNPLQVSARSVFCFQPIGDLMTRKGLFDSLLQGCIPVLFDDLTAAVMYTWHWDESFWKQVSVDFVFHSTAYRYFNPILALKDLLYNHTAVVRRKQELIRSRVFELQYGLDGRFDEDLTNKSYVPENWPLYSDGTPMRDAYEIAMDHILGWQSGLEPDVRNGTVPECWGKVRQGGIGQEQL
jgi:Exostosin family